MPPELSRMERSSYTRIIIMTPTTRSMTDLVHEKQPVKGSKTPLNLDEALQEQRGAELVGWSEMYRTCLRDKRLAYPPPPLDCASADEFIVYAVL